MTPDPYLIHKQLLTLIRVFAPNMTDPSVCNGTTKMWIQAVLTDNEEEGNFYARSAHLPFHFARLNNKIKTLKKEIDTLFKRQIHSPHPFSTDELNKIEIRSFPENVATHQHLAYTGISEDVLIQDDPIVYSLTRSKKLEEKCSLKN